MPSPFPGMDPYLEEPALWTDLHQRLITYAADSLAPQVRPQYRVRIGERVYLTEPQRGVYPDVVITRHGAAATPGVRQRGGIVVAEAVDTPVILRMPAGEVREVFIELVEARSGNVVTVIEVLSPANKIPGAGRELYQEKQRQVLETDASLVEIDLLRRGERTVAVPAGLLATLPPHHYRVVVSRAGNRAAFEVYPATIRDRLPRVSIPLRAADDDVRLDLPALLALAYENGDYGGLVDYTRPPDPPFDGGDAEWARAAAGRRA